MTDTGHPAKPEGLVEVVLHGPFAMTAPDGTDLTPKPHKARAVVALLLTAPDRRRTRRWIEERLWSDRGPQQAAGSLRQALVDLRKALAAHRDLVVADREWVELAPSAFRLAPELPGAEFMEGLAIRDPAFQRWLDGMRRHKPTGAIVAAPPEAAPETPISIRIGTANLPGTGSAMVAEIVAARIASEIARLRTDGGHSIITPSEDGRDRS